MRELQSLSLRNNSITQLPPNALTSLVNLTSLNLEHNQLPRLVSNSLSGPFGSCGSCADGGAINVSIQLGNNSITSISDDAFAGVFLGSVAYSGGIFIGLQCNQLATLNFQMFAIPNSSATSRNLRLDASGNDLEQLMVTEGPSGDRVFGNGLIWLDLHNNSISVISHSFFLHTMDLEFLDLSHNALTVIPMNVFSGNVALDFLKTLNLSHNPITAIAAGAFAKLVRVISLSLSSTWLESIDANTFGKPLRDLQQLDLSYTNITYIGRSTFGNQSALMNIALDHAKLTVLGLEPWFGTDRLTFTSLDISLTNNDITMLGNFFAEFPPYISVRMGLSHNRITSGGISEIFSSYCSAAPLHVNISDNRITVLPHNLFATQHSSTVFQSIEADFSRNPLREVSTEVFLGGSPNRVLHLALHLLQLPDGFSFPSNSALLNFTATMNSASTLTLNINSKNMNVASINSFAAFPGASLTVNITNSHISLCPMLLPRVGFDVHLNLSDNAITAIHQDNFKFGGALEISRNQLTILEAATFGRNQLTSIDFSHNNLVTFNESALYRSVTLLALDVSYNNLTYIPNKLSSALPNLNKFVVHHNMIMAVPSTQNRIFNASDASSNILVCSQYWPTFKQCKCTEAGMNVTSVCGYQRCMSASTVCANGTFPTGCVGPFQDCTSCGRTQFYDNKTRTCTSVSNCSKFFKASDGSFVNGYQYNSSTLTSDRECTICPKCEPGYKSIPCTETSSTKCVKVTTLSKSDIVLILLATLTPLGIFVLVQYLLLFRKKGRAAMARLGQTQVELELTEHLLGGYKDENQRMRKVWAIEEADIVVQSTVGDGTSGTVKRGMWGHIPVAVKLLRVPLDDLDPQAAEDFDREVRFMQSIRHPHLLIFYGAGVSSSGNGFLVTELMEGSLRQLLADRTRELGWASRWTMASDIARGMKHLHGLGMLHCDLKSENCLVDAQDRVKVADFGNSRLLKDCGPFNDRVADYCYADSGPTNTAIVQDTSVDETCSSTDALVRPASEARQTTTVGTPLWRAPELFEDSPSFGFAIDSYSFGIVLWELWSRVDPWSDIEADSFGVFYEQLKHAVLAGRRPCVPPPIVHLVNGVGTADDNAPAGYEDLMKKCWAAHPRSRPKFKTIVEDINILMRS
eukprot:m.1194113 g.1194113  ORF g.1194113 m.1194113 type:complete len:1145 (+) comp24560_c0_seq2:657-4091(+)